MVDIFPKISLLFGLSGSDLKDYHIRALEKVTGGQTMKMNVIDLYKPVSANKGADVYSKISEYRQVIETLCEQQVLSTPVIVIACDEKLLLTKKLRNQGIPVEPLF